VARARRILPTNPSRSARRKLPRELDTPPPACKLSSQGARGAHEEAVGLLPIAGAPPGAAVPIVKAWPNRATAAGLSWAISSTEGEQS
jgi:hypothetical protein